MVIQIFKSSIDTFFPVKSELQCRSNFNTALFSFVYPLLCQTLLLPLLCPSLSLFLFFPPPLLSNVVHYPTNFQSLSQAVSSAVVNLVDASEMVKSYTILLKKALDDSNPEKRSAWQQAVAMSLEKDRLLSAANESYGSAKNALTIALHAVEGGRRNPKTRLVFWAASPVL